MTEFPSIIRFTTTRALLALSVLSVLALAACVTSPHSRTAAESSNPVSLNGFSSVGGQMITIQAVDQNTGNLAPLGMATSSMSGTSYTTSTGVHYTLYPWSYAGGVLAPNYWSPQSIVPDLATSQGHLELVSSVGAYNFRTFSQAAFNSVLASGLDPLSAGARYSDGDTTVLFDQTGVGSSAATPWVNVQGMISASPSPSYPSVAWSVGYYTVEGGKKIYALICAPTSGGPSPVIVFNHGGFDSTNGGNITGVVTAAGWTSQPVSPVMPDGLGQCLDWAKRGWVFATSSYRGESVNINSSSPDFPTGGTWKSWKSDGVVEFCMGEVTDVMALTDLVMNHASAISVGSAGHMVPLNVNGKLFMYGYSHGGCITYRAVEQGAPVTAFSVAEGFTDMRLGYLTVLDTLIGLGQTQAQAAPTAAISQGAVQPGTTVYQPDAAGVMGYNWRSAHYFASRGDLSIQRFKTMPILILHGDVDVDPSLPFPFTYNPVYLRQAAEISADIGATNIFVGPSGVSAPSSEPCIDGTVGAPLPSTLTGPNKSCPISFTPMDTGDSCMSGNPPAFAVIGVWTRCSALSLPLTPPPGQAQQQHYLVVYNKMNHVNGGFAIKNTFDAFVEHNFLTQPGCDGAEPDCASD